jgi:hypothetical protein
MHASQLPGNSALQANKPDPVIMHHNRQGWLQRHEAKHVRLLALRESQTTLETMHLDDVLLHNLVLHTVQR